MNSLQINSLRAATQLIDRARLTNGPNATELLTNAVGLIEEVIKFDELVAQARALEQPSTNA